MEVISWLKNLFGSPEARKLADVDLSDVADEVTDVFANVQREQAEREAERMAARANSPAGIAKRAIDGGQAPPGMNVAASLSWKGEPHAPKLPAGLTCHALDLEGTDIQELPPGLTVRFRLSLRNCTRLERLPAGLRAGSLDLAGCVSLEALPEDFATSFLDISDCPQIDRWPNRASLDVGRLRARNCLGITALPPWIGRLAQLDLRGCANFRELPEGLKVSSWIDVGGTGIRSLPLSLAGVGLRWRGVRIDERIAFRPQEITADEILQELNAELRRVKLERMGYERFLSQANPEILDSDADAGGKRTLLRVPLVNDEPLVCVSVFCPSTARQYLIRVPPDTLTCRQAIAWTASFENADDYRPTVET